MLLPPDLRSWLPAGHLALFVVDAVEELDLVAFYGAYRRDGWGRPAYDPAVMVALILYAYAKGVRSAREIERRCVEDVAFRVVAANLAPDHATDRALSHRSRAGAGRVVLAGVGALRAGGDRPRAGVIAVDSTKVHANASGLANMDFEQLAREILAEAAAVDAAEDELYGQARGDELPPELVDPKTRRARLRELLGEIEAEQQAEAQARQAMLERRAEHQQRTGRRPPGRPPAEHPKASPRRVNVTDPDSRPVKTPRGFIQGYNAHAVAAEGQIIVAADVTTGSGDQAHLEPLVAAARSELAAADAEPPEVVLADAGYWAGPQIRQLTADGITVLIPPDGHARGRPNPRRRGGLYDHMRQRLASDDGAELYRRRMTMIEPIFGQTKTNRRADRFQRRGLPAVRSNGA